MKLLYHFFRELLATNYDAERVPEKDLVMNNESCVQEYKNAVDSKLGGISTYYFHLRALSEAIKPGQTILDLACGPGDFLIELAKMHPDSHFIGIDLSEQMLKMANNLKKEEGLNNVSFIKGDMTTYNKKSRDYDGIICTFSLHHLDKKESLLVVIRGLKKMIKPQGFIYVLDFCRMKERTTVDFFVYEIAKRYNDIVKNDYKQSLLAAFSLKDFKISNSLLKQEKVILYQTFGVPFIILLTNITPKKISKEHEKSLGRYWTLMSKAEKKDYLLIKLVFYLGGFSTK